MMQSTTIILLAVLVSHVYSAPQFISFKDGKIGVNFAGYHAAAGLGGILGGGAGGGLFAEAGTPYGQSARAGLGGAVDQSGHSTGGLYAGATAGGNVRASAGLGGGVTAEKAAGTGFAEAQAGNRYASSGLGGESSVEGASGFTFSGTKSFGVSSGVVKQTEVAVQPEQPVAVEVVETVPKQVHTEVNVEATNEVKPLPLTPARADFAADFNVRAEAPATVLVKEVSKLRGAIRNYHRRNAMARFGNIMSAFGLKFSPPDYYQRSWQMPRHVSYNYRQVEYHPPPPPPPPTNVVEKHIYHVRSKPHHHHHHFHKTAYIGGYIGAGGEVPPPPPPAVVYQEVQPVIHKRIDVEVAAPPPPPPAPVVVYKHVQPVIHKRIDVGVESNVNAGAEAASHANAGANFGGGGQVTYRKQINVQRNPTFFQDIFNIPISTLNAVGNFLGNAAGSTSVSVQKSASVHTDSDTLSSKHAPSSLSTSGETQISVQTPTASKIIGDIFAIPINTLSAVNKFLENNVPARKTVEVNQDGEATRVRRGPHARRRANKRVVVVQENSEEPKTVVEEHQKQ